ncbi:MAG: hypothetical protein WBB98_24335 [Xanthobacteraceae bacterium]|jgi:methionine synthase II (cobalamin-independent)
MIQIDETALREGLPLRYSEGKTYLGWAAESFRLCCERGRATQWIRSRAKADQAFL